MKKSQKEEMKKQNYRDSVPEDIVTCLTCRYAVPICEKRLRLLCCFSRSVSEGVYVKIRSTCDNAEINPALVIIEIGK